MALEKRDDEKLIVLSRLYVRAMQTEHNTRTCPSYAFMLHSFLSFLMLFVTHIRNPNEKSLFSSIDGLSKVLIFFLFTSHSSSHSRMLQCNFFHDFHYNFNGIKHCSEDHHANEPHRSLSLSLPSNKCNTMICFSF